MATPGPNKARQALELIRQRKRMRKGPSPVIRASRVAPRIKARAVPVDPAAYKQEPSELEQRIGSLSGRRRIDGQTLSEIQKMSRLNFAGKPVVILASGPSLTTEDIDLVKTSGLTTIAVNLTFKYAPWATLFFAGDDAFLNRYAKEMKEINPNVWTVAKRAAHIHRLYYFNHSLRKSFHSGERAIQLAIHLGAKKILLLGFDCCHGKTPEGKRKTHFFGDHAKGLGNAISAPKWPKQLAQLAREIKGQAEVINCSRVTAATCFPRQPLAEALYQTLILENNER